MDDNFRFFREDYIQDVSPKINLEQLKQIITLKYVNEFNWRARERIENLDFPQIDKYKYFKMCLKSDIKDDYVFICSLLNIGVKGKTYKLMLSRYNLEKKKENC